jgi:hypothetical protein
MTYSCHSRITLIAAEHAIPIVPVEFLCARCGCRDNRGHDNPGTDAPSPVIPLRRESFRRELVAVTQWYSEYRPRATLGGKTPNEVYGRRFPANRKPRIEPRSRWPRGSPCVRPWALVAGKAGQRFQTTVTFYANRRHLPIVTLKRAA